MSKPQYHRNLISQSQIPNSIRKILAKLHRGGFDAKLVGGCLRDILLDLKPKDFDVVTNATPEQVLTVFKRANLIGRRFKIVHVPYDAGVVEVSTYRKIPSKNYILDQRRQRNDQNLLNAYGSIVDDYRVRDFTMNALYYDLNKELVIDYVGGLDDIRRKTIRTIGRPNRRFEEDVHRVLRAIRFQTKQHLHLDASVAEAIQRSKRLFRNLEPKRLHQDLQKLLLTGTGYRGFTNLKTHGLVQELFPNSNDSDPLTIAALKNTDKRVSHNQPVRLDFLLAALYWNTFRRQASKLDTVLDTSTQAWELTSKILEPPAKIFALTRPIAEYVNGMWVLQRRMEQLPPVKIRDTLNRKRFRAAFDLLSLRGAIGEVNQEVVDWWENFQELSDDQQDQLIRLHNPKKRKRRTKKKRRKTPTSAHLQVPTD